MLMLGVGMCGKVRCTGMLTCSGKARMSSLRPWPSCPKQQQGSLLLTVLQQLRALQLQGI